MPARLPRPDGPSPTCRQCGHEKVWGDSRWRCRNCLTIQQRERVARLSAAQAAVEKERHNLNRRLRRAADPVVKERNRARSEAWRIANRERHRELSREHYRKNAQRLRAEKLAQYYAAPEAFFARNLVRKARLRDAECEHGPKCVTAAFLRDLYAADCAYCGAPAEHADHFEPLARGGRHCVDNLVPACSDCNLSKHDSDPGEWLARKGLLAS